MMRRFEEMHAAPTQSQPTQPSLARPQHQSSAPGVNTRKRAPSATPPAVRIRPNLSNNQAQRLVRAASRASVLNSCRRAHVRFKPADPDFQSINPTDHPAARIAHAGMLCSSTIYSNRARCASDRNAIRDACTRCARCSRVSSAPAGRVLSACSFRRRATIRFRRRLGQGLVHAAQVVHLSAFH